MKKTITQRLVDELKIHNSLRTYFDSGSSQFGRTEYIEKFQTLSTIISHGFDLNEIIEQYKSNYSGSGYQHVYNNVGPTLVGLISYLRTGNTFDLETRYSLENATEEEIVKQLTDEIKEKIINQ